VDRSSFIAYWYVHLPNFVLAVLMYTLLARVILGLIVAPDSQNYIWRFFCRITDPVAQVVGAVTPKACPPVIIWLFAFVWIFWLRLIVFIVFNLFGLAPTLGTSP
jgi:YggT family protein